MSDDEPKEPSVLDYLKSRLSLGRRSKIEIPLAHPAESAAEPTVPELVGAQAVQPPPLKRAPAAPFPWLSLLCVGLALLAQWTFEPPHPTPDPAALSGVALYLLALAFLLWAILRGEWRLSPLGESSSGSDPGTFGRLAFWLSIPFAALAFLFFAGNLFTPFNLTLWAIALALLISSLWLVDPSTPSIGRRLREFLARPDWQIRISRWTFLILAFSLVIVFFRVYHIQQTPAEPFSDHAEKLLDVYDVTQGQTHIFFPRNTGREAIQFYWTVLMNWIFGTGLSFLTLKIDTIGFGLLTLPYVYLLGKEIGGSRVGLLALVFTGVAYWPNVISRIGLRYPLYPLFAAPTFYYLVRGLRTRNRNDFILSGIFLGIGLHGYTPFRVMPVVVLAGIILFALHAQSRGARRDAWIWFFIVGIVSLYIFLPLLRYAQENPGLFMLRTLSRVGTTAQPLPGPWYQVLASNVWNALLMFNWDDGAVWVNSIPHRPALDIVTGALFLIGVVLVLGRYLQKRHWLDLFLLVSIPLFQLSSTLSLAFPNENPELNRAGGAYMVVFILCALALDGLMTAIGSDRKRRAMAWLLTALLLFGSARQSYDLVFNQFDQQFRIGAWNSSEMGEVIKEFGLIYGETDTVWIVPFPYWVDTRLPGVWAGIPNRDFAVFPDELASTTSVPGTKLFMVKADLQDPTTNDEKSLDILKQLYPQGMLSLHHSPVPGKDFWIYFVPAP